MRIFAVADIHGQESRLDLIREKIRRFRPDGVVVAGDFCGFRRKHGVLQHLNQLPVPVLLVRGNADPPQSEAWIARFPNLHSLNGTEFTLKGVPFSGISGALPLPFRTRLGFNEARLLASLESRLRPQSVIVAHPPPFGACDRVWGRWHAGSKSLAELIRRRRPALFICGHIHENPGRENMDGIPVVNCSLGHQGQGAVIDFAPSKAPDILMV